MSKPRLLDLFCGAGGAAMGYHRAGFDVVGVDINPQPRFPFEWVQMDALEALNIYGGDGFDVIHASPPCQRYSQAQRFQGREHPDLVGPVRDALNKTGKPWVIENVPLSPVRPDLILCGKMFGLGWEDLWLYRHRLFESNVQLPHPPSNCRPHDRRSISIFGHNVLGASKTGGTYRHPNERWHLGTDVGRAVMGTPWMNRGEMSESIPPAYTEWIGMGLIRELCLVEGERKAHPFDVIDTPSSATVSGPTVPREVMSPVRAQIAALLESGVSGEEILRRLQS